MKKHFWGILIFLVAFFISFLASPIRFSVFAVGSGEHGGFTSYESTYFRKVSVERERFETPEEVDEAFSERVKLFSAYINSQEVLELKEDRALITFQADLLGQSYCIIRKGNTTLYYIYSTSLWHAREFEKQQFRKK
jgi:hypothetical protein